MFFSCFKQLHIQEFDYTNTKDRTAKNKTGAANCHKDPVTNQQQTFRIKPFYADNHKTKQNGE